MCGVRPCGGGSGEGTHEGGRVLGCGADRESLAPTPSRPLVAGRSARRGVARPVPFLLFLAGTTRIWFLRPFSQGLALTDRLSTGVRTTLKTYTEQSIRRPVCVTRRRRHHGARSRWRESAPACRGGAPARLFCVERTKCSL